MPKARTVKKNLIVKRDKLIDEYKVLLTRQRIDRVALRTKIRIVSEVLREEFKVLEQITLPSGMDC